MTVTIKRKTSSVASTLIFEPLCPLSSLEIDDREPHLAKEFDLQLCKAELVRVANVSGLRPDTGSTDRQPHALTSKLRSHDIASKQNAKSEEQSSALGAHQLLVSEPF